MNPNNIDKQATGNSSTEVSAGRLYGAFVSIFVLGLVMLPLLQNLSTEPVDSFPLSYYPMFSKRRSDITVVRHAVATDRAGKARVVPYNVLARGGMNQVRKQINRAVRSGDADRLCHVLARKVAKRRKFSSATDVSIVTSKYRLSEYMRGEIEPIESEIEATCPVPRRGR